MGKVLTDKEQCYLIKCYQEGNLSAMDKLVEANQGLVCKIANRFYNIHKTRLSSVADVDDFISEGNIGLMRGIQKFDTTKDVKFSTYAGIWITQKCKRFVQEVYSSIHIPAAAFAEAIRKQSLKELGIDCTLESSTVADAERALYVISLNKPVIKMDGIDTEVLDYIEDTRSVSPEEEAIRNDCRDLLQKAIDRYLTDREARIVKQRVGWNSLVSECSTLQAIGDELGVSKERIRQIELKAFRTLKRKALKEGWESFLEDYN